MRITARKQKSFSYTQFLGVNLLVVPCIQLLLGLRILRIDFLFHDLYLENKREPISSSCIIRDDSAISYLSVVGSMTDGYTDHEDKNGKNDE